MKLVSDSVQVVLDWHELGSAHVVGTLHVDAARGTPVFSFEYDSAWLQDRRALALDPDLALVRERLSRGRAIVRDGDEGGARLATRGSVRGHWQFRDRADGAGVLGGDVDGLTSPGKGRGALVARAPFV